MARTGDDDEAYRRERMIMQPGYGNVPWINNRADAEAWYRKNDPVVGAFRQTLYDREIKVMPAVGRVLLYRLDVWHRGTPLTTGSRRVMNMVWFSPRAIGTGGRWNMGFWKSSYDVSPFGVYAPPDKLFVALCPDERMAIGFPGVTDVFWSPSNLRLLEARFPRFDTAPYLARHGTKL